MNHYCVIKKEEACLLLKSCCKYLQDSLSYSLPATGALGATHLKRTWRVLGSTRGSWQSWTQFKEVSVLILSVNHVSNGVLLLLKVVFSFIPLMQSTLRQITNSLSWVQEEERIVFSPPSSHLSVPLPRVFCFLILQRKGTIMKGWP